MNGKSGLLMMVLTTFGLWHTPAMAQGAACEFYSAQVEEMGRQTAISKQNNNYWKKRVVRQPRGYDMHASGTPSEQLDASVDIEDGLPAFTDTPVQREQVVEAMNQARELEKALKKQQRAIRNEHPECF